MEIFVSPCAGNKTMPPNYNPIEYSDESIHRENTFFTHGLDDAPNMPCSFEHVPNKLLSSRSNAYGGGAIIVTESGYSAPQEIPLPNLEG